MSESPIMQSMREKFATYQRVCTEAGPEKAQEALFAGYPERQRQMMGQFINGNTLAEGFRRSVPLFAQMGMVMEVVDLSNQGQDAVLEISARLSVFGVGPGVWRGEALHSGMRTGCESDAAGFSGDEGQNSEPARRWRVRLSVQV